MNALVALPGVFRSFIRQRITIVMTTTKPKDSPGEHDGRRTPPPVEGSEMAGAAAVSQLLAGLSDICLVADAEGRVLFANEAARDLLHLEGRVLGRKTFKVLSDRRALGVIDEVVRMNKPRSAVMPLTLSSEGPRLYEVNVVPFESPGYGMLLRIAVRHRDTNSSAQAAPPLPALEAFQALADPLSIIQGYLENLLDGDIKDPVAMRQCLAAMQRQTVQVQRILRSLQK
jgi:two-component system OmpR family sensor kinase/two-component system phosphate regulon sensor histidine kinase PhoR